MANQQEKLKEAERNGFYKGLKVGGIIMMVLAFILTNISSADIPRIEPYVNDYAGLLTPAEELQLNQLADQIESNTTFEIAIVTVLGTDGQDRLEFANMIGDQNGVGKKDTDNGVVVLWSVGDDQGGAIATGRGSESFITDSTTGTIGRAARSQYFDKEEYAAGFNYILVELDKVIIKHQTPINTSVGIGNDSPDSSAWLWGILFSFAFMIFIKLITNLTDSSYDDSSDDEGPGYYRRQVYKRHGRWYNPEAERSYSTAAAAAAALALMGSSSDDDSDYDSDDDSSSSSSGGFSGGSFGGGGFGGGGGKF